jgi:hypothetical protein
MGIDMGNGTGLADGRLMVIGNNSQKAMVAYLRSHSAAKISKYDQVGAIISNLA